MIKTKLRYATWSFEDAEEFGIIHHATKVLRTNKETKELTVTTSGHYSTTTKERLNNWNDQDLYFFIVKGEWMVKDKTDTYPYSDGMVFKDGQLVGGE